MTLTTGARLTLTIEKAVAGGRMLARHDGLVVLVSGAIPGEEVEARVTRVAKGVTYAETVSVLSPSPDRCDQTYDSSCGGSVFAHIVPARQRALKAAIVTDAMFRLGGQTIEAPQVMPSPVVGYRMRARFRVRNGRLGFYREGSHELCDAAATGQLLPATAEWIASMEEALASPASRRVRSVELTEDVSGRTRVCHLELVAGTDTIMYAGVAEAAGLAGLSASRADQSTGVTIAGSPQVTDRLSFAARGGAQVFSLTRNVRAFFQSNRFLVEPMMAHVVGLVPQGQVVDLYAGVGLFGLALASAGARRVTLVESDPVSGVNLAANAVAFGSSVRVIRRKVETFLARAASIPGATVVVDPPRTGLSKEALDGVLALAPGTLVYVSCDPATFARDTRRFIDGGYVLDGITVFDLFPNTAHVETVARFRRA